MPARVIDYRDWVLAHRQDSPRLASMALHLTHLTDEPTHDIPVPSDTQEPHADTVADPRD